jgi:hypothetical protein
MKMRWAATGFLLCQSVMGQVATVDWSHQLHTPGAYNNTVDIALDPNGNILAGGSTGGSLFSGSGSGFVAKYDPAGALLWGMQYPAGTVAAVAADSSGNIYTGGEKVNNVFVQKSDTSGNVQWTKTFATNLNGQTNGLAVDNSGNAFIAGGYDQGVTPNGPFISKYDPNGNQLWTRNTGNGSAWDVAMDHSNAVLMAGSNTDAFVRKYDTNGNITWTQQWGSSQPDSVRAVAVDPANNIFVGGSTTGNLDGQTPNPFGDPHAFITKLAGDGTIQWSHELSIGNESFVGDIATDSFGNVYLDGTSDTQLLLASFDPNGNLRWSQRMVSPSSDQWWSGLATDATGQHLWIGGYIQGAFNGAPSSGAADDALVAAISLPEPHTPLLVLAGSFVLARNRRKRLIGWNFRVQ